MALLQVLATFANGRIEEFLPMRSLKVSLQGRWVMISAAPLEHHAWLLSWKFPP